MVRNINKEKETLETIPETREIESKLFTRKLVIPEYIQSMSLTEASARMDLRTNTNTKKQMKAHINNLIQKSCVDKTTKIHERNAVKARARMDSKSAMCVGSVCYKNKNVKTESGKSDMKESQSATTDEHENIHDQSPGSYSVVVGKDAAHAGNSLKETNSLNDFFSRPVQIFDATWAADNVTNYSVALEIWDIWSRDQAVRAKLSNYAFFRGDMHLKISLSGTKFHYGRVMLSYQPFPAANSTLQSYDDLIGGAYTGSNNIRQLYINYLSQSPGVTTIDIKENEPVEMVIPFTSSKEAFRLFNESSLVISDSTPFTDFADAGELRLVTTRPLTIANEDFSAPVSLNVYAWVDNIQLSTTTATNVNVTAESGKRPRRNKKVARKAENIVEEAEEIEEEIEGNSWEESMKDKPIYDSSKSWSSRITEQMEGAGEYNKPGPVQTIATAVSNVGNALGDVPFIGGFAKATGQVAGMVGKAASWFGFSKPVLNEKPALYKAIPWSNPTTLSGHSTTWKIACDPLQELSVKQDLGGNGEADCMAIAHIASRDSLISIFEWDRTDIALDTNLFTSIVSPMLYDRAVQTGGNEIYQPSAMMFAAMPFTYWRGTITYRFDFVCSDFHRGKCVIKYEPNVSQFGLITSNDSTLNQQNTVIVDLQETQSVEIKVGWTYDRNFARTLSQTLDNYITHVDTVNHQVVSGNFDPEEHIGFIQVRPMNELVQPTDDASVHVHVYARCDDLEVAVPTNNHVGPLSRRYVSAESGKINGQDSSAVTINSVTTDHTNVYLSHFGERVVSFRSLLKRFHGTAFGMASTSDNGLRALTATHGMYPNTYLYPGSAATYEPTNQRFNLYDYLRYGFMGVRGGYRYRINNISADDSTNLTSAGVQLFIDSSPTTDLSVSNTSLGALTILDKVQDRLDGALKWQPTTSGGIEFEIPYYSPNLFDFAFDPSYGGDTLPASLWLAIQSVWEYQIQFKGDDNSLFAISVDSASAEDFTFLRFQGAPIFTQDFT